MDCLGLDSDLLNPLAGAFAHTVVRTPTITSKSSHLQNYILLNVGDVVTGTGSSPAPSFAFLPSLDRQKRFSDLLCQSCVETYSHSVFKNALLRMKCKKMSNICI